MRIHQLSPQLTQQIAAGEVIERPASVVKELLENSFDAGADHIDIHIVKAGKQRISIQDDGCGIEKEDLALALACHATSKIRKLADLEHIASLGFRGEALASIAAISHLTLTSRTAHADQAWQIRVAGEKMQPELQPAAHPIGTTVCVDDLFFNTPARRRFLRADKTEYLHIETMLKNLALSHFDVALRLQHAERQVFHFKRATSHVAQEQRVQQICGKPFLHHAAYIDFAATGLTLHGWLGDPSVARSQTDLQFFYLNGRLIRDRIVLHAIRQAYDDYLEPGRQPAYVLYLTMEPCNVDVNVHPTKHEVRFHESRLVHDFITQSLRKALRPQEAVTPQKPIPEPAEAIQTEPVIAAKETFTSTPGLAAVSQPQTVPSQAVYSTATPTTSAQPPHVAELQTTVHSATTMRTHAHTIFGLLHHRYIILETQKGFTLIDYPKAQQYLALQKLQQGSIKSSPLLIPQTWQSSEENIELIIQLKMDLETCGVDLERLTPTSLVCRHMPAMLHDFDFKNFCTRLSQKSAGISHNKEKKLLLLQHLCAASFNVFQSVDTAQLHACIAALESLDPQLLQHSGFTCYYSLPSYAATIDT